MGLVFASPRWDESKQHPEGKIDPRKVIKIQLAVKLAKIWHVRYENCSGRKAGRRNTRHL